jgi:hypothetical protein
MDSDDVPVVCPRWAALVALAPAVKTKSPRENGGTIETDVPLAIYYVILETPLLVERSDLASGSVAAGHLRSKAS